MAAGPELTALFSEIGLHVTHCRPINWKRDQTTPLYYVEATEGRFVLKRPTPPLGVAGRLRRLAGDWEIDTQTKVYRSLAKQCFEHLKFPRLVASDGRNYLLLEYIETRSHEEHDLPRNALLYSLLEFQSAELRLNRTGAGKLLAMSRSPSTVLLRRFLRPLCSRFGLAMMRRGLEIVLRCHRDQPPLERPVVCHNDFHHNNLLLGIDGGLYFSDFESVSLDDRWALADIIHYGVGTQDFLIDKTIMMEYAELLRSAFVVELDIKAQMRFGLLLRVSKLALSRVPSVEVAERYGSFLREVLLDDQAFDAWLDT
jgi:hypothetical protein